LLYRQLPFALIGAVVVATLLVTALWTSISGQALILWWLSVLLLSWIRYRLARHYQAAGSTSADPSIWERRFLTGVIIHGLFWGAAGVVFFVDRSYLHQTLLVFALAGMSAGSVSTLSSVRGAYPAYMVPALLPYAVRVFAAGTSVHLVMGAMVLLFVALMWRISGQLQATIAASLRLRFENLDLIDDLTTARDRQDAAYGELGLEIEAKQNAQRALQASHDELESRVRERTRELAETNERLDREKELFRTTLARIADGVITMDSSQNVTYLNAAAERYTGWPDHEARGAPLAQVFKVFHASACGAHGVGAEEDSPEPGDGGPVRHWILIHRYGQERHIDLSEVPIPGADGNPEGTVLTFRDISRELATERQLSYQATHDSLTGLINRPEFERRLARILRSASETLDPHALVYIDLDRFKNVNDTCGHVAGDELLRRIAGVLRARIRTRDTFARIGGDEFGVIMEHCAIDEAARIAGKLRELADDYRFTWDERSFKVSLSIGLVAVAGGWQSTADVLSAADRACYAAKNSGRNCVHVYEP
jgi:diguanylate cyclase (GGDEF)-like protein/PAS domain S-box-containing protein